MNIVIDVLRRLKINLCSCILRIYVYKEGFGFYLIVMFYLIKGDVIYVFLFINIFCKMW